MIQAFMALTLLAAPQVTQPAPTVDPAVCAVDADVQMSRPWAEYEFSTDMPGGPMWLASRGCYAGAARISLDYLAKGPLLSVREQAITQLHMARNLAYSGDEIAAAQAAASARRSDQRTDQEIPLDWNSYVQGLYGFLIKDRGLLEANRERLMARVVAGYDGDAMNGRNLSALATCFDRTYLDAMSVTACWSILPSQP